MVRLGSVDFLALLFAAEAHGGIGGFQAFRGGKPYCQGGLCNWLDGEVGGDDPDVLDTPMFWRVFDGGLTPGLNDRVAYRGRRMSAERYFSAIDRHWGFDIR